MKVHDQSRAGMIALDNTGKIAEASSWIEDAAGFPIIGAEPESLVIEEHRAVLRDHLRTGQGQRALAFFPDERGMVRDIVCTVDTSGGRTILLLFEGSDGDRSERLAEVNELLVAARRDIAKKNEELMSANEALRTSELYIRKLEGILPMCMNCSKVRDDDDSAWLPVGHYLARKGAAQVSHGLCPTCAEASLAEMEMNP